MESWLSFVTTPWISFVSKSESICEAEELDKIEVLQNAGKHALSDGDGALALHLYNEALEIDGGKIESLCGRCLALLLAGAVGQARQDAASVIHLAAENPRGYYLEALCLEHDKKYEDSLKVLLHAFDLRNTDGQIISERILSVAQKCLNNESCAQPEDPAGIQGDDDFETLTEAGKILIAAKKPDLAVDVLVATMKLDIKRTEAAVAKQQLLIGQALAESEKLGASVSSFQDCLKSCESFEDSSIIKVEALSRLAGVHTKVGDPLHAIICYEKLLDLANETTDRSTRTISGSSFLCRIHLNLSIAYRSFGLLDLARHHARLAHSVSETDPQFPLHAEVRLNLGNVAEAMGDYKEAVTEFEGYRKLCKQSHDENGLMTSYGCLGNVYARLNCCQLTTAYHNRQVTLARNSGNSYALALASEMEGDSFVLLRRYSSAIRSYQQLLRIGEDGVIHSRVGGYLKLGRAFMLDNKDRYARLCFEKALSSISGERGSSLEQLVTQVELSLALILMNSDDQEDLENAKIIYHHQVQCLEHELSLQSEHAIASHVHDLKIQLKECYRGLVYIFSKTDSERDALTHVERHNIHISDCKPSFKVQNFNMEEVVIDKLTSIAEHLKCCVIYYFLLPKVLLIWFMSASGKIMHVKKDFGGENGSDAISEAGLLTKSVFSYLSSNELLYSCENRVFPSKQVTGRQASPGNRNFGGRSLVNQCLQVANRNGRGHINEGSVFETSEHLISDIDSCDKNNVECKSQKFSAELQTDSAEQEADSAEQETDSAEQETDSAEQETDSAEQRLYDLLVLPIETVLQTECVDNDHIIIVPCETLSRCPFWSLGGRDGLPLGKKYHVTVSASLTVLNTKAEKNSKRNSQNRAVDVEEELSINRCGIFSNHSMNSMPTPRSDDDIAEMINPKHTSNPRLAVLSGCGAVPPGLKKSKGQSDVAPLNSSADMIRPPDPISRVQDNLENMSSPLSCQKQKFVVIGAPSLPKCVMLNGHESTLLIEENRMKTECVTVADLLGADCVIGNDATKDRFLQELSGATILHIATLFSPELGNLAMAPNPMPDLGQQTLVDEALYLVQADEIMATMTSVKLVIISGGWSVVSRKGLSASQALVSTFLSAGASCVLGVMYPVPSEVLACFYESFYRALPSVNGQVSLAFQWAIDHINLNERFRKSRFSSAFALIGVDTTIDMISVSQSMIFHSITRTKDLANTEVELPSRSDGVYLEGDVQRIQKFLSSLVLTMSAKSELLPHLIELLEVGSVSSTACEPFKTSTMLQDDLCRNVVAIKLLHFLGFTFQPPEGVSIDHPYVLVPCSDDRKLLSVCLEALQSLNEMSSDCKCLVAVQQLLPVTPSVAVHLSNLLSHFESDPNGEMKKASDYGGHFFSLWRDSKVRTLLICLGFRCLGHVFHFRNTTKNRKLLHEMNQLLRLLGPSSMPLNKQDIIPPVLCLGSTWATEVESSVRMEEKIHLSSRVKEEKYRLRKGLDRALTWHKAASAAQGRDVLQRKYSKPFFTRAPKVKVHGGSTPSQARIPVDQEIIVDLRQMEQRRDYAHFVYKRRLDQVRARHQGTVSNFILPHLFG